MAPSLAGAQRRRFVLLPVLALALAGAGQNPSAVTGSNNRGVNPKPKPSAEMTRVKAVLLRALDAERIFRVDHLAFAAGAGAELDELRADEDPAAAKVGWGTEVIVELPSAVGQETLIVVLRAPLASGESLCLSEVTTEQDAGVWYARAAAGAKCPVPAKGMPGWSVDEATGWS